MAILTAETIALLNGRSFELTAIEFDGTAGTPPVEEKYFFGTASVISGAVTLPADTSVNGRWFPDGNIRATVGALFALENIRYEQSTTVKRIESLDLSGATLIIDYGLYKETYTEI